MSQQRRPNTPRAMGGDISPNQRALYQTRITALKAEIASLEAELQAAEQRTEAIVNQYEQILNARTTPTREPRAEPPQTDKSAKDRVQQFLTR